MERCGSDKDGCQQFRCNIGIQLCAGRNEVFERMALLDGNQRTGLVVAQQHRRRHNLIDEVLLLVSGQGRDPGKYIRLAEPFQHRSYLRLKDDNDRKESPVNEDVCDIGNGLETEQCRKGINDQYQQNTFENLYGL